MPAVPKVLGILKPIGGGDPIPLTKESLIVGRRPSCDICLDFDLISGKHCELRFLHGIWHVRDLGSTNGTTVNGMKFATEQSVLPDVEVGIASRLYTIDYEPAGPASVIESGQVLEEEVYESRKRKSLMELAGLESSDGPRKSYRPSRPPEQIERPSVDEAEFEEAIPRDDAAVGPLPLVNASDEDFFNLIQEDLGPKKK